MKTPEELTKDWKAGKLDVGFYYVKGVDGLFGIMSDYALYRVNLNHSDNEMTLLAPVPTYDEYKAMQEEFAEHRHYCCCMENEVMRLDKAKLEEEIAKLKEKIKKKEELIQCLGSNIDELDVKKSVLIIENNKLRRLLEECVPYVTFKMNIEKNIGCTPPGAYLLTRINAALGESEEQ